MQYRTKNGTLLSADGLDTEIMKVLTGSGRTPTYAVRNLIARVVNVKTPVVLRRLKKLELDGKVKRVKTDYKVMLCWSLV